ncbi:amino acid ABC transporter permease [Falsibacillus pallidus]|uniref:Amino acid ABC transporter membrane protein 2 (PAAT family) n=1 Tax=Falsibacillus pallidus TaxID=493781 RepID=A0A370G604_9BACI|nr:amino acid ABC transporter permease [Falsibacillus pallidus]RDI38486.1 amino acid ABC transporter membrane protein 2 (PAAT family) [Falsibacillus pallidus]
MDLIKEAYTMPNLIFLGKGVLMTLLLAFTAIVASFIIGAFLAIFRYSKTPIIGKVSFAYVEIVRNTPLILILFFTFFGLPELGIDVTLFWKLAIALIIFEISQLSEIVRSGLNSIEKGQIEAARSQGLTYIQTLIYIIMPQAFKRMIPAIVGQFITIVKDTSYTSMFGLLEILNSAKIIWNQDFDFIFPIIILVAVIYFVINFSLSTLSIRLERRLG